MTPRRGAGCSGVRSQAAFLPTRGEGCVDAAERAAWTCVDTGPGGRIETSTEAGPGWLRPPRSSLVPSATVASSFRDRFQGGTAPASEPGAPHDRPRHLHSWTGHDVVPIQPPGP